MRGRDTPRQTGEEHEESEEVGKRRVGTVPCILCFWTDGISSEEAGGGVWYVSRRRLAREWNWKGGVRGSISSGRLSSAR